MLLRGFILVLGATTTNWVLTNSSHATETDSKPLHVSAELGSIFTSGNTDTESINAKLTVTHQRDRWLSTVKLGALSSKESDVTSAEKYTFLGQLDYATDEYNYLANILDVQKDRFSGFDYRSTIAINFGRRLITRDALSWDIEIGPGYRRDKMEGESGIEEEAILRLANRIMWSIGENASLQNNISSTLGDDNQNYQVETSLTSQINGNFSTKLSHVVNYVAEVPEGSEKTDSEFGVTLVVSY